MRIQVISDPKENPFSQITREECLSDLIRSPFPRSYLDSPQNVDLIWKKLYSLMGKSPQDQTCLEIGAGANIFPATTISSLGAKVTTLDADWREKFETQLPLEEYRKLKQELGWQVLIPKLRGKIDNVDCYLGDLALLDHEDSELQDKKFDLVYFWGSIEHTEICSSIQNSQAAAGLNLDFKYKDRMEKTLAPVKENGALFMVPSHFNGHLLESPEALDYASIMYADLGLYFATRKRAKKITYFIQGEEYFRLRTNIDTINAKMLLSDPFTRLIEGNNYSMFGNKNNYSRLQAALEQIKGDRKELCGTIDGVLIQY